MVVSKWNTILKGFSLCFSENGGSSVVSQKLVYREDELVPVVSLQLLDRIQLAQTDLRVCGFPTE